ncbi:hypothetical protein [Paraburkholderia sp. J67]|uniref:hypothetical protein n=1 Tax=Paraburkholderia sp. J67 TaxID=2805435 RepID=UPI002ABE4E04|nr:hypothetical protein [Paraburkholderia sp. J67]
MKRHTGQQILLLTATITPLNGINKLAYTDPAKRLRDYERALEHYLTLLRPNEQIVFCENSGSDLGSLKDIAQRMNKQDQIEFLSFEGNDFPPHYGRGYGEFKIVDHVMNTSKMVREAHDDTVIWKITGRYIVENLHNVMDTRPRKSALYCNFRDYPQKGWMDLFLMAWTPASYRTYLASVYTKLIEEREGGFVSAELLMREQLTERRFAGPYRFKRTPRLVGVRGADGASYHNTRGRRKYLVRRVMSIFAPWVWI